MAKWGDNSSIFKTSFVRWVNSSDSPSFFVFHFLNLQSKTHHSPACNTIFIEYSLFVPEARLVSLSQISKLMVIRNRNWGYKEKRLVVGLVLKFQLSKRLYHTSWKLEMDISVGVYPVKWKRINLPIQETATLTIKLLSNSDRKWR